MSTFIFLNNHNLSGLHWGLKLFSHTGDGIRIQMIKNDKKVVSFLSLLLSGQTECMKNIMKDLDHYTAAFQSYLKAPLRNPEQEVALLSPTVEMIQSLRKVRVLMCAWESGGGVMIQDRKWENILGNNILVWPDQSFLGFYRAAPWQKKRRTPQRYCLLGFSPFWARGGGSMHWRRCCNPAALPSRRMLPRCGAVTPSPTGRRCAKWWGASTPGPSPSTELWATSPQESTEVIEGHNLPWSSTTVTQQPSTVTCHKWMLIRHTLPWARIPASPYHVMKLKRKGKKNSFYHFSIYDVFIRYIYLFIYLK